MKRWGLERSIDLFTELESHYCDKSELNNAEGTVETAKFYPVSDLSEINLQEYAGRFKCLTNPSRDLKINGNYDTVQASNLLVAFEKCNNQTSSVPCKSPAEIQEFLKFKYMIGLWN